MIVATLLPLAKLDDWWIRILDFPRLQIAVISTLVLVLTLVVRQDPGVAQNLWLAALTASTLYQAFRMYPYDRQLACITTPIAGIRRLQAEAECRIDERLADMSKRQKQALQGYAFGLCCIFIGAWLTDITASMLPLALGAATAAMSTVRLVRSISSRRRDRNDAA
jgi:hypothetical protein